MTTRVDDPAFAALPQALQYRIDDAFRRAIGKTSSRKRRKLNDNGLYEQNAPGGFILDDSTGGGFVPSVSNTLEGGFLLDELESGGGFIVDDYNEDGGFVPEPSPPRAGPSTIPLERNSEIQEEEGSSDSDSQIPLSLIPTALQSLDLPPDDEQVLLVFRNAASGWTSGAASAQRSARTAGPAEEVVSLRDWRAVCSVLLEPDAQYDGADEDDRMDQDGVTRMSDELVGDGEGSSEEYAQSDPEGYSDQDDDNYSDTLARQSTRSTRRRNTRANKVFDESDEEDVEMKKNRPLTTRQKETSRQAFALFFPPSTDSDLEKQRITISDLVRVSKELNEKITYDQVRRLPPDLSWLLTIPLASRWWRCCRSSRRPRTGCR